MCCFFLNESKLGKDKSPASRSMSQTRLEARQAEGGWDGRVMFEHVFDKRTETYAPTSRIHTSIMAGKGLKISTSHRSRHVSVTARAGDNCCVSMRGRIWRPITSQRRAKAVPIQRLLQMQPTNAAFFSLFLEDALQYPSQPHTPQDSLRAWKIRSKKKKRHRAV